MKSISLKIYCLILIHISFVCFSCKKYLDEKADASLSTPGTLSDLQALADNYKVLNYAMWLTNVGTDEYYILDTDWNSSSSGLNKEGYVWDPQVNDKSDWDIQYKIVFYANTILDNLTKISSEGQEQRWKNIKGYALFFRAHSFYQLAQLYAKQYDPNTASTDPGIPLRLNSDFNVATFRSTVQQTYDRIIQDLTEALTLLPNDAGSKNRPNRAAAFAQLARTYLQMGNYAKAKENSESCLQIYGSLMDYNNDPAINQTGTGAPFARLNPEVIFYTSTVDPVNALSRAKIDSMLYLSFASNDKRKSLFFSDNGNKTYRFRGSYNASLSDLFNGIATDEVYLIRAEANARLGNTAAAMQDLNTLLIKRWVTGTFTPLTAVDANDALNKILVERKKELIYRGARWADLKRLNKDGANITLVRKLNGQIYTLQPNDLRYALLIPVEVIAATDIPQNPR